MGIYLEQLIKTVEAEATEEHHLKELAGIHRFPSKRGNSALKRTLQRLEVLKSLRKADRHAATTHWADIKSQR
jgi:capsid protein